MLSYYRYFICLSHSKAATIECQGPKYEKCEAEGKEEMKQVLRNTR